MNTNLENKKLTPEDLKGGFAPRHCQPEPDAEATDKDSLPVQDAPKPETGKAKK